MLQLGAAAERGRNYLAVHRGCFCVNGLLSAMQEIVTPAFVGDGSTNGSANAPRYARCHPHNFPLPGAASSRRRVILPLVELHCSQRLSLFLETLGRLVSLASV